MKVFEIAVISLLLNPVFQQLAGATPNQYSYYFDPNEYYLVPGEFFPSCVEVINVWPPPNSILKPTVALASNRSQYIFRITFSRPVTISHVDASGGWQPEIAHLRLHNPDFWGPLGQVHRHLYRLDRVAPVFLSPSHSAVERYYPHRVVNWHGSSREFLFYFSLPTEERGLNLKLSPRVYLVVDGSRFYTFEKIGSGHLKQPLYVPTAIIGDYYFAEYLKKHNSSFTPKPQLLLHPSSYCKQRKPRPFFVNRGAGTETPNGEEISSLSLNEGGHGIQMNVDSANSMTKLDNFVLHLSLSTHGNDKTHMLSLPPTVTALYNGVNVTVKLPTSAVLTIKQPTSPTKLFVPVKRVPIYELRERIYHNVPKIANFELAPVLPFTNLTNDPRDTLSGIFPETTVLSNSWRQLNVEVVDRGTRVKLKQYFPFWEDLPPKSLWWSVFKDLSWMELTRNAPIAAKALESRYRPGFYHWGVLPATSDIKFLQNSSRLCPVNSHRNPGRRGSTIYHVIEYGPLYHLLEPHPRENWSTEDSSVDISVVDDKGLDIPVSLLGGNSGVKAIIPSAILEGLERYRCLLPPIKTIPKPSRYRKMYEKWILLDKCIFVATPIANSRSCGGLQLFKNVVRITEDTQFCSKRFGTSKST